MEPTPAAPALAPPSSEAIVTITFSHADRGQATCLADALLADLGGVGACSTAERELIRLSGIVLRLAQLAARRNQWPLLLKALAQARATLVALGLKRRARLVDPTAPAGYAGPEVALWRAAQREGLDATALPPDRDPEQPDDDDVPDPMLVSRHTDHGAVGAARAASTQPAPPSSDG